MLNQSLGRSGEDMALKHLLNQGMTLVQRNYLCRMGEIDLILRDGDYLVFAEVRLRSSSDYGGGLSSITQAKQRKIIKASAYYMVVNNCYERFPMRFDVVSIDTSDNAITWIKAAFTADYYN